MAGASSFAALPGIQLPPDAPATVEMVPDLRGWTMRTLKQSESAVDGGRQHMIHAQAHSVDSAQGDVFADVAGLQHHFAQGYVVVNMSR